MLCPVSKALAGIEIILDLPQLPPPDDEEDEGGEGEEAAGDDDE
jgi:hypothetical protein